MDPKGREGGLGPGVPGKGKEFLRRLQVKVPSCMQRIKKTNIQQTAKKQSPRTSGSYLART